MTNEPQRTSAGRLSCSVHEKCSNLTGVPWKPGTGAIFFYCSSDGSNKKLASSKIHIPFFFSCDKKFIKVNVKPTFYCSLL